VIGAVIVNFNTGPLLAESVQAALASTEPVEVVVVDNGSSDDSLGLLRSTLGRDPRLRIIENGANLGFARANNIGLKEAAGDHLVLLNPDCVVAPDALARVRAALEARPDAGMAGGLLLNDDGTEQEGCRRSEPRPGRAFLRAFGISRLLRRSGRGGGDYVLSDRPMPPHPVEVDAISGAFMMVKRGALDRVGPLDEGYFLHCEDLDWCLRFRQAGYRVLFVPGVAVVHDKGASSRTRPVRVLWHMHRGMVRFYRKFYRDVYPRPFFWLVLAGVCLRFGALASLAVIKRGLAAFGR
jgi:GT2 family glycosyltransferase